MIYSGEENIVNANNGIQGNITFHNKGIFNLNGGVIEGGVDSLDEFETVLNFNGDK